MYKSILASILMLAATAATAAPPPQNFAGKWVFDPAQSKNIGMMAQASITTVIVQTKAQVIVDDTSMFKGQPDTHRTVYDLTGAPTTNTSMMTGQATTRSHWEGAHLVTEWVSPGAIAGTVDKRIEQRYISPDGKTMVEESAREGHQPMVIVFTRAN